MRKPEYLNKQVAAKRTGLSVRRLLELAHRNVIRKQFVKDPHTKRTIAVFAAEDLDRLDDPKKHWTVRGREVLPISGSGASVDGMRQSGKSLIEPPAAPTVRQWMTLAEADLYIGLPEGFLLIQVKSGKLPALDVGVRPGGRWRVSRRDLEAIAGERLDWNAGERRTAAEL